MQEPSIPRFLLAHMRSHMHDCVRIHIHVKSLKPAGHCTQDLGKIFMLFCGTQVHSRQSMAFLNFKQTFKIVFVLDMLYNCKCVTGSGWCCVLLAELGGSWQECVAWRRAVMWQAKCQEMAGHCPGWHQCSEQILAGLF